MRFLLCLLAAAALASPAHAEIYKWVDRDGKIHYSDSPPSKGARVIAIQDRLSIYSPEPAVAQALRAPQAATPPSAALADRVAALERQRQSERLARQSSAPDLKAPTAYSAPPARAARPS